MDNNKFNIDINVDKERKDNEEKYKKILTERNKLFYNLFNNDTGTKVLEILKEITLSYLTMDNIYNECEDVNGKIDVSKLNYLLGKREVYNIINDYINYKGK